MAGVSKMKIAYLINAHKNFEQLDLLIEKLGSDDVDFYLHIDKKVDDREFSFLSGRLREKSVTLVTPRVNISWGGSSQVEATLNGLATVLQSNVPYEYVHFISGQDYPLKSNSLIMEFLAENHGKEFMDSVELSPDGWAKEMYRFRKYHLPELIRNKMARRLCEYILNRIVPEREFPAGYVPYGGSSWWTLSNECADYILTFTKKNPNFLKFFKLTHAPDEMYFQTVIMNSPFKQRVLNDNLRYVDWSEGKQNPKILTAADFPELLSSDKLFARKFDISVDATVLDLISGCAL